MYRRAVEAKRAQTELEELVMELRAELKESGKKNTGLQHAVDGLNKEIEDLHGIIGNHKIEINRLESILEKVKAKKGTLTFDSLRSGGILEKYVKDFTYFATVELNEAFLEVINYADGSEGACEEGDGLCQRLARYTHLSIAKRKAAAAAGELACQGSTKKHGQGPLDYKTEYLAYCLYAHAGMTQRRIAPFFGISETTIHNTVYCWANLMDDILKAWFPPPTHSQMLAAYPCSLQRKWGHARTAFLLDACEVQSQDATRLAVHAAWFSTYKDRPTLKFLAGSDGIGVTWAKLIPDGKPGATSDQAMTKVTKILRNCPFGWNVEVDKGFVVDNEGAKPGVCIQ
jgi:hypothetical protein